MLKPFSGEMGPIIGGFGRKLGSKPYILVSRRQKALLCAEPHRLTYFASKSVHASRL